jgi:hypothetical protein
MKSFVILIGAIVLGVVCIIWVDWLAGALLVSVGVGGFLVMAKNAFFGGSTDKNEQADDSDKPPKR